MEGYFGKKSIQNKVDNHESSQNIKPNIKLFQENNLQIADDHFPTKSLTFIGNQELFIIKQSIIEFDLSFPYLE